MTMSKPAARLEEHAPPVEHALASEPGAPAKSEVDTFVRQTMVQYAVRAARRSILVSGLSRNMNGPSYRRAIRVTVSEGPCEPAPILWTRFTSHSARFLT